MFDDTFRTALRPISKRAAAMVLLIQDSIVLEMCVLAALWLRSLMAVWFPIGLASSTFQGIYFAVMAVPLGCLAWGLYPGYGLSPVERLRRQTLIVLVGFGLMSMYDYLAQNGQWSRGLLLIATALAVMALPLCHLIGRSILIRLGWWGEPVALFGRPERCQAVIEILRDDPGLGWIPAATRDWPPPDDIHWDNIEMAILLPPRSEQSLAAVTDTLSFHRFVLIPDFGGGQSLGVSALETGIGLGLEMRNNLLHPANRALKRILDLLAAILLAPFAAVVVAGFAIAVRLASPGPAFYGQWREGLGGRPFRLWKIRSMVPSAEDQLPNVLDQNSSSREQWQAHMKLKDDPRIIRGVGSFMRRFSIDELPQILNVLKGEMSMVGPRPLPPYHLMELPQQMVELRRQVRPGISGWAQISGRSRRTVFQQIECDSYYIRNWSPWIDTYVLIRTAAVVISARGAY